MNKSSINQATKQAIKSNKINQLIDQPVSPSVK